MRVDRLLSAARLDLPALSRLSGVSYDYLRQLSAGKRGASADARRRIAVALRTHAKQCTAAARTLEKNEVLADAEALENGDTT